ncbi:hypothetical protein JCM9279_000518 [Rhodotorula babjevae]
MAPHPGPDVTAAASSSSSSLSTFPPLTPQQRRRIEDTLANLEPDATTWADLTRAQHRLAQLGHPTSSPLADHDDDPDDDSLYELWLKLVWQHGVTWHDKWAAAQQPAPVQTTTAPTTRNHRRRPSDNLDLLRRKLDRVSLEPPASPRRPPDRPQSTPPRPLLVHRPAPGGYSSSDDQYAGVPTPRARRTSLLDARLLEARRQREPRRGLATTDDDGDVAQRAALAPPLRSRSSFGRPRPGPVDGTDDALFDNSPAAYGPMHSTPAPRRRPSTSTPRAAVAPPVLPSSPPPPAPLSPSRHPLLHARLSALSHPRDAPDPLPPPPARAPPARNLDALALSFSRLRLLLPTFAHWSALATFHTSRSATLAERRAAWLARCALRTWRARVERVRELEARGEGVAHEWDRARDEKTQRGALALWRTRRLEREQARDEQRRAVERDERERALRRARDDASHIVERGRASRALEAWRGRAREARAERFRMAALGRAAVRVWASAAEREKARDAALAEVAREQWGAWEGARARGAWGEWLRRTACRVRERELVRRRQGDVKRDVWDTWTDKKRQADHDAHLTSLASTHHARHLASLALSQWRTRLSHLSRLSRAADARAQALVARRAASSLVTWRLSTRLSLLARARSHALAESALAAWLAAYEHVEVELAGRADALVARKGAQLCAAAFGAWHEAVQQKRRLEAAARGVDRARVLRRVVGRWKAREEAQRVQARRADVVRDFMQVRGAWRSWCEKAWEGRRARWEDERRNARKKEAFDFWLSQTRQKTRDEQLVNRVQERQAERICSKALEAWKARVIARKSLEQDASAFFGRKAVLSAFKRWTLQAYRAEDRLVLADEHRAVKLEELRDRIFHAWLLSTRRSSTLRSRLSGFLAERDERDKAGVYDAWRDKALRGRERAAVVRREGRERAQAWEHWKGTTKTLAAMQHYNYILATRAFEAWRGWTTPPELVLRAVETDHGAITSGALQVWRIKTSAKRALKSLSGRMRLANSLNSSPPSRLSPSTRPIYSATSSPSSAPPSLPLPASAPRTAPSAPLSTSLGSASASTAPTSYHPSTSPSLHRPQPARTPSRSTAASAAPQRPRLSAEYAASPEHAMRAGARPARTARSHSIVSRLSGGSARSAPGPEGWRGGGGGGGGGVFVSSDEEEDEEGSEDGRWRRGGAAGAATRSEGGGVGERDAGQRDVRGEYAALRARLRAAAVAAKGR